MDANGLSALLSTLNDLRERLSPIVLRCSHKQLLEKASPNEPQLAVDLLRLGD